MHLVESSVKRSELLADRRHQGLVAYQRIEHRPRVAIPRVELGQRHDESFVQRGDRTPAREVGRRMARIPVSSARTEERSLVREVAVESGALNACTLRNRGHRRLRWAERLMELDGALGDSEAGS